jgi:long-chain-alcohol oxidase
MEALRAMCGALIPSLQPEEEEALNGRVDPPCGNKDLERFYLASGADSTVPDESSRMGSAKCGETLEASRGRF